MPEHAKTISALAEEIWKQHYHSIIGELQVDYMLTNFQSYENISREISDGKMIYYIIYSDGSEAGYCAVRPEDNQIFLSKLYIKKEYRRLGIAKKMIRHIAQNFNGKSDIYLTVNKHNDEAIAAYKNMGFSIHDSITNDIGAGYVMDDYIMRLPLSSVEETSI